ncbi:MAG: hypothetical protein Unbinned8472contig1000_57 [Prokaryotic dsDNA virus sp.]|nr:MAG: hypothetical protein Unbinned8472contig1000_57 [Prokaryotic dsDNA virus sp.]|tara:strand:+ start:50655 stop:51251 length:597 start_codon:yes stop_codon:yes gene_type:complete
MKIKNPGEVVSRGIEENFRYNPDTGRIYKLSYRDGKPHWSLGDKSMAKGYRLIRFKGKAYLSHRVAYFLYTGEWPELMIDHKNRVKDDNRWDNLRQATAQENSINSDQQGKSDKWIASDGSFIYPPSVGRFIPHKRHREVQNRWLVETRDDEGTTLHLKSCKSERIADYYIENVSEAEIDKKIQKLRIKRNNLRRQKG